MEILSKLLGSAVTVRVLRFFLFHPHEQVATQTVRERTGATAKQVRSVLTMLSGIGFLKERKKTVTSTAGKKKETKGKKSAKQKKTKKQIAIYSVDQSFVYLEPLRTLLLDTELVRTKELQERFKKAGHFKTIIISGALLRNEASRLDMLLVGDKIDTKKLKQVISSLESDLGTELRYALFDSKDFLYRMSMQDRLIRDVLDYQHTVVVNKL